MDPSRRKTKPSQEQAAYPFAGTLVLLEDDGAVAVPEHPIFEMLANGTCQYAPFDLAPQAHQVLFGVAMGNVGDILVDYETGVELFGDVMGRGTDSLYATASPCRPGC